jgi:hypothetical protein
MDKAQRKRELRDFGERVMTRHLTDQGFKCELLRVNHRCFDISALKDGQHFLYSVKSRNHTTRAGAEKKDDYNLLHGKNRVEEAYEICRTRNAIPMWATVRVHVDKKVYDAYFGQIDDLPNKKSVPMNADARQRHNKFGEDIPDQSIKSEWTNVRDKASLQSIKPKVIEAKTTTLETKLTELITIVATLINSLRHVQGRLDALERKEK